MLRTISLIILGFFIAMEIQTSVLLVLSSRALVRDARTAKYGRVEDMLRSPSTPPVSLIVPAYNEAAGIVESVRSRTILSYPRYELIVVNDGSTDDTLDRLKEAFKLRRVDLPIRPDLAHAPIRAIYKSTLAIPLTVVDKENGGKGDALNAGINASTFPYVVVTDADMIFEEDSLIRVMRPFVQDRGHTVAVGGNIRPLNGCQVSMGRVTESSLPTSLLELTQVVEYQRSFLGSRPGWSFMNGLLLVSGAFGAFNKQAVIEAHGFPQHHLGEDLDLTMRLHRTQREAGNQYRIVYAPNAVVWTEVPSTAPVLRKQRIRWHRGLRQVIQDHGKMLFNPRYGFIGMVAWPAFFLFEFVAPILEAIGWIIMPITLIQSEIEPALVIGLLLVALLIAVLNSLASLYLDERYGHFNSPRDALRLLRTAVLENFGPRQRTVWWRFRSLFWRRGKIEWGDMERTGVGNVG